MNKIKKLANNYSRFMEAKVPVWLLLLVVLLLTFGGVIFGALALYSAGGGQKYAALGKIATSVANYPLNAITALRQLLPFTTAGADPYPGEAGLKRTGFIDNGYLLLSTGERGSAVTSIKLIRLADGKELHRWTANVGAIVDDVPSEKSSTYSHYLQLIHPLLTEDGGIVGHPEPGPLIKVDRCSRVQWVVPGQFHHAIEVDAEGNYWVPGYARSSHLDPKIYPGFKDNTIEKVSPDGKVLFSKSVAEILIDNGYIGLLLGQEFYNADPIHLNQIYPVRGPSKYWEMGDLLVSIRNRSAVFLYRPRTNKITWLKVGPWLAQHDVRVVDGAHISVFGNDVVRYGEHSVGRFPNGHSNIYLYDLDANRAETPFSTMLGNLHVALDSEGRARMMDNGDVFVEETNTGRLMRLASNSLRWTYVARERADQPIATLNWSRYVVAHKATEVMPHLTCGK